MANAIRRDPVLRAILAAVCAIPMVVVGAAWGQGRSAAPGKVAFSAIRSGRASVSIYDSEGRIVRELLRGEPVRPGRRVLSWDGLDGAGRVVPEGEYEWRAVVSPGFVARFITRVGISPPDGRHQTWVGDHAGPGGVAVDRTGIYISAELTEGLPLMIKLSPDASRRVWDKHQYYEGGIGRRIATNGQTLYLLQTRQDFTRVRKLDPSNAGLQATWDLYWDGAPARDMDAVGPFLALAYPGRNAVRWVDADSGKIVATVEGVPGARNVALLPDRDDGAALVEGEGNVWLVEPDGDRPRAVIEGLQRVTAVAVDPETGVIFITETGDGFERVLAYDRWYQPLRQYGGPVRRWGEHRSDLFRGLNDICATGRGTFFVTETEIPRRTVEVRISDGAILNEWFGGLPFYIGAQADRSRPDEVWVTAYGRMMRVRMNYDAGTWTLLGTYSLEGLGQGLFHHASDPSKGPWTKWSPRRVNGTLYLACSGPTAVVRFDEQADTMVPVALAMPLELNDSAPAMVRQAAAAHESAFTGGKVYLTWSDANADGRMDATELQFADAATVPDLNAGTVDDALNYVYSGGLGGAAGRAGAVLPARWNRDGVLGYDLSDLRFGPPIPSELEPGFWAREAAADEEGNVYLVAHGGLYLHDQLYSRWPIGGWRTMRLLKARPDGSLAWVASRSGQFPHQKGTGRLFYPTHVTAGPNDTVLVNDQIYNLAMAFTRDGLFLGNLLEHRAADGMPDSVYATPGDDYQPMDWTQTADGRIYYFGPHVGYSPVYEITGWDNIMRYEGTVRPPGRVHEAKREGEGLRGDYAAGSASTKRVDPVIRFAGPEALSPPADGPFNVTWLGRLESPVSEPFTFFVRGLNPGDTLTLRVGPTTLQFAHGKEMADRPIHLQAGRQYPVKIDYHCASGTPALNVMWFSLTTDLQRLPTELLYPAR